jgi:fatty acid synthase
MYVNADRTFVTGIAGRFPSSPTLKCWWSNLCEGVDLVSDCSSGGRYPYSDYCGLPDSLALIADITKFDNRFFGVSAPQANCLDPQVRMLLECVFEAVADAGYTMQDLAGSNTGVYVGGCFSDLHKALLADIGSKDKIVGYENTGCCFAMFANRISFHFDFRGPSLAVDTACSSSMVALDLATRDLASGRVSRAVVAGVSLITDPSKFQYFVLCRSAVVISW